MVGSHTSHLLPVAPASHALEDKRLAHLWASCRKKRCYITQKNTREFRRHFTYATRPGRHRLANGLGRHAVRRTRICPTPARISASAPHPCARAAQHPPRSARGAV